LWTVPLGVAIGQNPRLSQILQPLVQIAASVPATALFPVLLLALIHAGGGLQIGSVALMMLGTMWYLLFNVIAGAQAIPSELFEAAQVYKLSLIQRWQTLILPGIFPYLITGIITAVGGAWNASIVSEYVQFKGEIIKTSGLGETISEATASGNFPLLLAATSVMSLLVVLTNRLVWRPLYRLAQEKYQLLV
jgi:NitT/TauT family transport system permease protein